ncbi:Zinc finger MYM-type protein 1-like protein [Heracleum sosnowskyi]|uniref:Zinc finger MYM-type protein 1-like protein n=1 Tax=Heracleum sosnowskyi TaxID=360622 RepID=A0AAD8HTU3_9APIA|nr:Zinc finger MYM-type protein 1-like protein [Heracleum sosnowskyi]
MTSGNIWGCCQCDFRLCDKCYEEEQKLEKRYRHPVNEPEEIHMLYPIENCQQIREEVDVDKLPIDPAKRKSIYDSHVNDREKIRRFYLQKGPCQPKIEFPRRIFGEKKRRFVVTWYKEHPGWLEYSVSEHSVYFLCCYLFKPERGGQSGGDVFVTEGFTNWKEALRKFREHVGDVNSVHNKCVKACQDLMHQNQHIELALSNQTIQTRLDYRTRLIATIDVVRLCLSQALAFRGHDESEESNKKGNFLTFLQFLADHNEEIKRVVLDKAPENNKLTSPDIQKDVVKAMDVETTKIILSELGGDLFSILVDESRDISVKEQMIVLLRYVDKSGCIVERFLGVVHVGDTCSLSLKIGVEELLGKHQLCIARIHGWDSFLQEVTLFCESHNIAVVDMSSSFVDPRRVLRKSEVLTNLHHYRSDMFIDILERQVEELNDRFGEIGTELLFVTPKTQGASVFNKCFSTINDIPGCFQEVLSSFFSIQIKIGSDCCKALIDIEDNCWSKAFPYITPSYPALLRTFCKSPPPHQKQSSSSDAQYLASPPAPPRKDASS